MPGLVTPLIPPPPPSSRDDTDAAPLLQAGQLVTVWSAILSVSWGLIMASLVALGTTSSKIGKPTWWVGDDVPARPTWTWLLPFLLPLAALAAAAVNWRWARIVSAVAAGSILVVGIADLGRSPGVAAGEIAVAFAAGLVTVASYAGRLRACPADAT